MTTGRINQVATIPTANHPIKWSQRKLLRNFAITTNNQESCPNLFVSQINLIPHTVAPEGKSSPDERHRGNK
jgi:hypothetical protein